MYNQPVKTSLFSTLFVAFFEHRDPVSIWCIHGEQDRSQKGVVYHPDYSAQTNILRAPYSIRVVVEASQASSGIFFIVVVCAAKTVKVKKNGPTQRNPHNCHTPFVRGQKKQLLLQGGFKESCPSLFALYKLLCCKRGVVQDHQPCTAPIFADGNTPVGCETITIIGQFTKKPIANNKR